MFLSGRNNNIVFEKLFKEESRDYDGNPSKGWYGLYPFVISEEPDFDNLVWSLADGDRIALVRIDIGTQRQKKAVNKAEGGQPLIGAGTPFTQEELDRTDRILTWFRKHDREVILRIAYDTEGKGMEHEPSLIKNVTGHMKQLGPVIAAHADNIIVNQGIFVGSWGEMHDSRFLSDKAVCELYETLASASENRVRIAVRTPMQHKCITQYLDEHNSDIMRPALYNDAILSSDDDMCTYTQGRAAWADYQHEVCSYAVCGGEVIHDNPLNDFPAAVQQLSGMHITYLNRQYDKEVLDKWRKYKWTDAAAGDRTGEASGTAENGYDYIGRHMGYRFVITDAEASSVTQTDDGGISTVHMKVKIANHGFACIYDKVKLYAQFRDRTGKCVLSSEIMDDMSQIMPGTEQTVNIQLPGCLLPCTLWLSMERTKDSEAVKFANKDAKASTLAGAVVI